MSRGSHVYNSPSIRVIPTRYRGVLYRSRTEARWAVLFHELGIVAQYEPEGYLLDGVAYLPDFLVAEWGLFVEVKGTAPTVAEQDKAWWLARSTHYPVLIVSGDPGTRRGQLYAPLRQEYDYPHNAYLMPCRRCDGWLVEYVSDDESSWGAHLLGAGHQPHCGEKLSFDYIHPWLRRAIDAARNERFGVHEERTA